MRPLRSLAAIPALLPLVALGFSACATPAELDDRDLPTLASFDEVIGNAPSSSDIPDDVKADGPLPAQFIDLVGKQTPIRNQGSRGVCTIFTSTALLEHLAVLRGELDADYSEQFLQWSQKRERGIDDHSEASALPEVMENLAAHGTVPEALWPYQAKPWVQLGHAECAGRQDLVPIGCLTNGEPPAAALASPRQKAPAGRFLRTSAIKAYLYQQRTAVGVGLEFIDGAWSYPPDQYRNRPGAWERGEVPYPSAAELAAARSRPRNGHAVLIVGWDDDYAAPVLGDDGKPVVDGAGLPVVERGFYIVKNSWGTTSWGKSNPYGAGYGLVSQRYVEEMGAAYVVGLPTGDALPVDGERHDGASGLPIEPGAITKDTVEVANPGPLAVAMIDLAIDHPSPSDLTVRLRHDNLTWTLWDHSPSTTATPGIRGTWRLSDGSGAVDRGGPWVLTIENDAAGAPGTLIRWSITLK